jgi:LPS-assembly protein
LHPSTTPICKRFARSAALARRIVFFVAILTVGQHAIAQVATGEGELQKAYASLEPVCPDTNPRAVLPPAPDRDQAPIYIEAEQLSAGRLTEGEAWGRVELTRADQYLTTDRLLFDPVAERLILPGPIDYRDQQVWFHGEEGEYSFAEETGHFSGVVYGLTGSSANGSAERVELIGGQTSRLLAPDYTTCPGDHPDWQLQSKELELRHDEGMGTARGAKLRFKGVPVLYVPWFTFPIDDRRRSGFLYPSLGQNSDTGLEFSVPWYWNIAPNHDATLEPRWFSERGFMLSGQYRFLTRRTEGQLDFDYMADDRKTGEKRYHYQFSHFSIPRQRWRTALVVDRVSDERYFQDYSNNLQQAARQFLRSSATLNGVGRYWNFELMADDFQVIDESIQPGNEPYRRLPRIAFWLDQPLGGSGLTFGLDSELVAFDREAGVTGARLDLYPNLYWDRYNRWGFIKPSVGYRYTAYQLDYGGLPVDESPSRALPIASLDAGLVFDRLTPDGGMQTLEPRLFYLYVPYEDQDELPVFDTGEFTFGFSQLFNSNRFAGGDRQGDTSQLSVSVSTRKFDANRGSARWSLGVGQIFYFRDRLVQLDGEPPETADLSPFLAEFNWKFSSRLNGTAGLQWNWDRSELDVGMLGLQYRGEGGRRLVFEYRYRVNSVDQFDVRVFWPVNDSWRVLSRVNYSFEESDLLEFQGGVEYESCCWAIRTVLRRYLRNRDGDYRDGIYLEIVLKGLGSIGNRARGLF